MPSAHQYQQLQLKLKSQILSGVFEQGDLLPSENELSRQHSLNRVTVRHALSLLEQEGYITKHQGKGSVVQHRRNTLGLLSFKGFSEVVGSSRHEASTRTLAGPVLMAWPAPFFYGLTDAELGSGCVYYERLRFADTDAVMLEYTYLSQVHLPNLGSHDLLNDSLFATLAQCYQVEITSLEQEVRAIGAADSIADKLQVNAGSPLIHIYRRYGTNQEGLFIYSSLYCNTEKYALGSFIS